MPRMSNAMIENAQMLWPNFAGRKLQYNDEGKRNFMLLLDHETAQQMSRDGWKIKVLPAKEEGASDRFMVKVNINFQSNFPPSIWVLTSRGKAQVPEDLVFMIDAMDVEKVDVFISPYVRRDGDGKATAYLKTIYVTLEENPLDEKYRDVQEIDLAGNEIKAIAAANETNQLPGGTVIQGEVISRSDEDPIVAEALRELKEITK